MSSTQEKYPQDLLSSYSTSGFAPSSDGLPFGNKPIFTVIDVCEAYLTPGSTLYAPERFHSALKNNETLIQESREKKIPAIFTRMVHQYPESGSNWYRHKIPKGPAVSIPAIKLVISQQNQRFVDRNQARL
ncbi:hypothetical protein ABVK25_012329 [Lepraria finkii]|uniref:Uncharacterized protein n=1 Tax=Lepraria finkii TaxID=1340010 RepID=A0ABR4AIX1_9LECA